MVSTFQSSHCQSPFPNRWEGALFFFFEGANMSDAFDSKRARELSSKDMVLFIYNYVNDTYVNSFEVDIEPPHGKDAAGRTKVWIKGLGERRLKGNGGYTGEVEFKYRRTPLTLLELPTDGTFFTYIREEIGFLSIVEEVARRTGFNIGIEDFVDEPFNPLSEAGYTLKASPESYRFEGSINLGVPLRRDLGQFLPGDQLLSFPDSDAQLSLLISRHYFGVDLTPWPNLITDFKVGRKVGLADDALLQALRNQTGVGNLDIRIGPGSWNRINLYQSEVVYSGLLRDGDMRPYHKGLDSVIVFKPAPNYSDGAIGFFYAHYNSKAVIKRADTERRVYLLPMLGSAISGSTHPEVWSLGKVGQLLETVSTFQKLSLAFQEALGIGYEPEYGKQLVVDYNGVVTKDHPLPAFSQSPTLRVMTLRTVGGVDNPFHGSTHIYY